MGTFDKAYIEEIERRIQVEADIKSKTGQPIMINSNNLGAVEELGYVCACNSPIKAKALHRPLGIALVTCPICSKDTYIMTVETFDN